LPSGSVCDLDNEDTDKFLTAFVERIKATEGFEGSTSLNGLE